MYLFMLESVKPVTDDQYINILHRIRVQKMTNDRHFVCVAEYKIQNRSNSEYMDVCVLFFNAPFLYRCPLQVKVIF